GPAVDPRALKRLEKILEATDCNVVLSSSWRHMFTLQRFVSELINLGLDPIYAERFIGVTPTLYGPRGAEIRSWPDRVPVESFVIIDDDSDMGNCSYRLIQTSVEFGLTDKDVDDAITMLNEKH